MPIFQKSKTIDELRSQNNKLNKILTEKDDNIEKLTTQNLNLTSDNGTLASRRIRERRRRP